MEVRSEARLPSQPTGISLSKDSEGAIAYLSNEEESRLLKELAPDREGSGLKPIAERSGK